MYPIIGKESLIHGMRIHIQIDLNEKIFTLNQTRINSSNKLGKSHEILFPLELFFYHFLKESVMLVIFGKLQDFEVLRCLVNKLINII